MPRFSVPIVDPATGKVIGIGCGSYRRKRCHICAELGAELECDGCDKPLCRTCAVSPKKNVDFCQRCFEPAWRHWLQLRPSSIAGETRHQRRAAFRAWVLLNVEKFLELSKPLTAAGVQARAR